MAYKEGIGENGKLPDYVLKSIDTGQKLYKPASISYMRMKNDAKKDGVTININPITKFASEKRGLNI